MSVIHPAGVVPAASLMPAVTAVSGMVLSIVTTLMGSREEEAS